MSITNPADIHSSLDVDLCEYKKIIFSGINGPFGYALSQLSANDPRYVGFSSKDCDLRNEKETLFFFESLAAGYKPSEVAYIHLAAVSGGAKFSANHPATVFVENMSMAQNSLKVASKLGIKRVIMTLSTACYSESVKTGVENSLHDGPIFSPDYSYAYAKRMQEILMRAFNKEFSMNISSVLVNGIIGPKMSFDKERAILPAALIRDFSREKNSQKNIDFHFDPKVKRQYTHSHDLAKIVLWSICNLPINDLFNIGSHFSISMKEVAQSIIKHLGVDEKRLILLPIKSQGRLTQETCNSKFLELTNYNYTSFDSGIKDTVNWYLENT